MNTHQFRRFIGSITFVAVVLLANLSRADLITLINGTATYSQIHDVIPGAFYSPSEAVDGDFSDPNGWAVSGGTVSNQTAVWETAVNLDATALQLQMHFLHANPQHLMGRFRFSVTTDGRSTFADGLANGGDVTANWNVLTSPVVTGPAGMTFTVLGDNSVLAGGIVADTAVYTINYSAALTGVTGFRLEALTDPSVAGGQLGFYFGNFLLTELTVNNISAVPEPSSIVLFGLAFAGLGVCRSKRKKLANLPLHD